MDAVINKISEIESAATEIMEDANARKKAFAKDMEDRTAAFDAQLEAETAAKIAQLRNTLEQKLQAKLEKQKSDSEKVLELMEAHYEKNHQKFVTELFRKMTEE